MNHEAHEEKRHKDRKPPDFKWIFAGLLVLALLYGVATAMSGNNLGESYSFNPVATGSQTVEYPDDFLFRYREWNMLKEKKVSPSFAGLCVVPTDAIHHSAVTALAAALPKKESYLPYDDFYLRDYLNKLAYDSHLQNDGYSPGSVIIKEKIDGSRPDAIGGMIKREAGYDPENQDWEYFYASLDDKKMTRGRISSCLQCHASAPDGRYVFEGWR